MLAHVHPLAVLPLLPAVYLLKTDLHRLCRPAHATRLENRTLVYLDRSSLLAQVSMWAADHLTEPERIAVRIGFGVTPDLTVPFDDDLLDGTVGDARLPETLELVPEAHPTMGISSALRSG